MESGTTELALPGLELPPEPHAPEPRGERGRWIERGPARFGKQDVGGPPSDCRVAPPWIGGSLP